MTQNQLRYIYSYEKFVRAVRSLMLGPGDMRSRLYTAYHSFHPVRTTDLPKVLHRDYSWIIRQLTIKEPSTEFERRHLGRVEVTLEAMRNKTAVKIAERVVKIHDKLEDLVKK